MFARKNKIDKNHVHYGFNFEDFIKFVFKISVRA